MIIYGASGHALVIQDILLKMGYTQLQFVDDSPNVNWVGGIVKSPNELEIHENIECLLAIGNNLSRKKIANKLNVQYKIGIHPNAILAIPSNEIGQGTVIMAGAVINPAVLIGSHAIINTCACIDHECVIGDFVHISPNATLCGNVSIGEGTHVGAGALIIQGIKVGKWSTIGAGSVIIRDVPDYAVVVGNPGKIIKYNEHDAI